MGQVIGALLVLGISLAVLIPVMIYGQDRIIGNTQSIADIREQTDLRAKQQMVSTHIQESNGATQIHLANIGHAEIAIFAVLVDGTEQVYTLTDQDNTAITEIAENQLAVLTVQSTGGSTVQIITESGKLFEIDL